MDLGVPPRFELRLATLVSRVGVPTAMLQEKSFIKIFLNKICLIVSMTDSDNLVLSASKTDSSLQGETPTMIEPPSTPAFFPRAFVACSLQRVGLIIG